MLWVYAATAVGIVPLLWLSVLQFRWPVPRSLWLLAVALGVSFVADVTTIALRMFGLGEYNWIPSITYIVSQASFIAFVFWGHEAIGIVGVILAAGLFAAYVNDGHGPDVILSTIASLAVVGVAWLDCAHRELRAALLIIFGLGCPLWLLHAFWLVTPTWFPYQGARLVGTVVFCYAAYRTSSPRLRLVTA